MHLGLEFYRTNLDRASETVFREVKTLPDKNRTVVDQVKVEIPERRRLPQVRLDLPPEKGLRNDLVEGSCFTLEVTMMDLLDRPLRFDALRDRQRPLLRGASASSVTIIRDSWHACARITPWPNLKLLR